MMARPLEPIRIKARKGDLRGYIETHNKLGQSREVSFVQDTADNQFSYASTIDRSQTMYPDEDGAIYFRVSDISATGKPASGAAAMTGSAYASYLETLGDPKAFGIGIDSGIPFRLGRRWKLSRRRSLSIPAEQVTGVLLVLSRR